MVAALMSLGLHERGNHAVWMRGAGQRARVRRSRECRGGARAPGARPESSLWPPMIRRCWGASRS